MKIKYIGKTCPYCKTPFKEGDSVVFCSVCDMPHHLSCWTANEGCTTFGCTGSMSEIVEGNKDNKVDQAGDIGASEGADNPKISDGISSGARYEVITELPEGKLQDDTEILIEKVSLIKDNTEGSIFVRCSFRSLTDKPIKALLVDVAATDVWGKSLEGCKGFQILDLKTKKDSVFGQTTPIKMPDSNTRGVDVIIRKILYEDMSMVECEDSFSTIGRQQTLDELLGDHEVVEEYVRETYGTSRFVPCKGEKIWRCSCGAINDVNHLVCYKCNAEFEKLLEALKPARLKANSDKYLEEKRLADEKNREEREKQQQEAEERLKKAQEEKERQEREEKEEKKKKRNRYIKRAVLSIVACIALVALVYVTGWHLIPYIRYSAAEKNVENKAFDKAYTTYVSLGNYKESKTKATETLYAKGEYLTEQKQYEDAAVAYESIPDYLDSKEKAVFCRNEAAYQQGIEKYNSGDFQAALTIFTDLGAYSDSKDWINKTKYAYANDCLAQKNYGKAIELFESLGNYEDSRDQVKEAKYLMATKLFDEKDYEKAYDYFHSLSSYKDSKEKAQESKYLYGSLCLEEKKYKEASDAFSSFELKGYKDSENKSIETSYIYAKECYSSKKYEDAATYFGRAKGYEDADALYTDSRYENALKLISSNDYDKAVNILENLGGYKDSKSKINECKYAYVTKHKNNKDSKTYSYLKELRAAGYKDSSTIYNSLYAWEATFLGANNSESASGYKTALDYNSIWYFHFKINGGTPSDGTSLKYTIVFPNGSTRSGKFDDKWYAGNTIWVNAYWTSIGSYYSATGVCAVNIFDGNGNKIGYGSVTIR